MFHTLWLDTMARSEAATLVVIAILALFLVRRPVKRKLATASELAERRDNILFRPTFDATCATAFLSLLPTVAIAYLGWRLKVSHYSTDFQIAAGEGLIHVALVIWSIGLARKVLRRDGLGRAHFGWFGPSCDSVRNTLFWSACALAPLVAIISTLSALGESDWEDSLGRLTFMVAMLLVAWCLHQLLRRRKGALFDIVEHARGKSSLNARRFGYIIALVVPIALFVAAGLGFYLSALHIAGQLFITLLSVFALLLVAQLLLRWMVLARRRVAREQARKRRDAMRESLGAAQETVPEPEEEIDLTRVDAQSVRLVRSAFAIGIAVACYFIWSTDLPALSVLESQTLWETVDTVQREIPLAGTNETEIVTEQVKVPITLRDAAVFLFIAAITFIAVQNLPGLLEIILLQRLSLIAGERYAIKSIVAYLLTMAGGIWAFTVIGLSWSKIQWLVAAVGLGLGFGLQEIFANLISGLIILFERPIRVGDTVTVGEISGTVSRIRIRATWITAFNRRELIVPNKEFVTGRLVNWTLSDQVLRVDIKVGIAYGSDTGLAKELIMNVARAHEHVLNDPEPVVYFVGFGDSSLDFELRAHCPNMDSFLVVRDAMHTGIDAAFRQHGIEIPFPQRDIHMRPTDPSNPPDASPEMPPMS
jgi:potassium-dependent mechanosensitive channel